MLMSLLSHTTRQLYLSLHKFVLCIFVFVFKNLFKHGSHLANRADFQWAVQLQ